MKTIASSIVVAALFVLSPVASAQESLPEHAAGADDADRFNQAVNFYEQMAEDGSVQAAAIAGTMLVCGQALYGRQVPQDRARAAVLLQTAANSGSPVAQLLLGRISVPSPAAADETPPDFWSEPKPFGTASSSGTEPPAP